MNEYSEVYLEMAQLYREARKMDLEALVVELMYINDAENIECEKIIAKFFSGKIVTSHERDLLNTYYMLYFIQEKSEWKEV